MNPEERFDALEHAYGGLSDQMAVLLSSVETLLARMNNLDTQAVQPPQNTTPTSRAPPVKTTTPNVTDERSSCLKPASPSEYDGDCAKGRAFLNSCSLYINLCPMQFKDDAQKVCWVLSYMKTGRAAVWADRVMHCRVTFADFREFEASFICTFYPENEATDAMMKLESSQYYQGRRSVDAYADEFEDLVEKAGYTDNLAIVLKFRRGLNPLIQDKVAEMVKDRPRDDDPDGWHAAARQCDLNRRANEAFHSSATRKPPPPMVNPNLPRVALPTGQWSRATQLTAPPTQKIPVDPRPLPPGIPMEVDAAKRKGMPAFACYRCGDTGHRARDCQRGFDIRLLSEGEREDLLEDIMALKDKAEEDFQACSE